MFINFLQQTPRIRRKKGKKKQMSKRKRSSLKKKEILQKPKAEEAKFVWYYPLKGPPQKRKHMDYRRNMSSNCQTIIHCEGLPKNTYVWIVYRGDNKLPMSECLIGRKDGMKDLRGDFYLELYNSKTHEIVEFHVSVLTMMIVSGEPFKEVQTEV